MRGVLVFLVLIGCGPTAGMFRPDPSADLVMREFRQICLAEIPKAGSEEKPKIETLLQASPVTYVKQIPAERTSLVTYSAREHDLDIQYRSGWLQETWSGADEDGNYIGGAFDLGWDVVCSIGFTSGVQAEVLRQLDQVIGTGLSFQTSTLGTTTRLVAGTKFKGREVALTLVPEGNRVIDRVGEDLTSENDFRFTTLSVNWRFNPGGPEDLL